MSMNRDPQESEPLPDLPQHIIEDPTALSEEDRRVAELLSHSIDVPALVSAVEAQEPADAADTLESLGESEAAEVLGRMDIELAAEALAEMLRPLGQGVLEDLIEEDLAAAAGLLEAMAPDDATDFLRELESQTTEELFVLMSAPSAALLRELLGYQEESAGGMMTTDFLSIREQMTVAEATDAIRRSVADSATQFAFVTNWKGHLRGIISLRRLLLAGPEELIGAICNRELNAIAPSLDREAVALEFEKYDFLVLPVVDANERLLGVVEVDDVIEIIRAQSTEDAQRMVGAGAEEAVFSNTLDKLKGRFPWLFVNLITSSIAAIIVFQFDGLIAEIAILAVLMPVIANQAGNAGQQSLAVTLRGIVLDQLGSRGTVPIVLREGLVGLVNGLVGGIIIGGVITLIGIISGSPHWQLGLIAGISMTVSLGIGTVAGSALPIVTRRLGADPATASTIFLTMITDSMSFLVFLGLAALLQNWLVS
ncbi:MAG: magnesium transporter [Planctomycetes bacterium TMED75]|nr:magnesium transporter [Planctomycetaceae bacterium]OUU92865.1 MAG: magnesium transporter [Planctomycetes bacterium TMED75]